MLLRNVIFYLHLFWDFSVIFLLLGFPGGSDGKESASSAGDSGSIPGSGISPGKGNGNPIQYSCLGNPIEEPGRLQDMGSQEPDNT